MMVETICKCGKKFERDSHAKNKKLCPECQNKKRDQIYIDYRSTKRRSQHGSWQNLWRGMTGGEA